VQYLHISDAWKKLRKLTTLYKQRPVVDIINKFKEVFIPSNNVTINDLMISFKMNFSFEQYMIGRPTKWGIKAWGIADRIDGCLLKCKIYLEKKRREMNMKLF
jgi:hypothetical protein